MVIGPRLIIPSSFLVLAPLIASANDAAPWQGPYAGVHIGGAGASLDGVQDGGAVDPGDDPGNLDPFGVIGGVQVGANWQFDRIVVGLDGDFSVAGVNDTQTSVSETPANISTIDIEYTSTIRGRAGYAFGDVLLYATAGVAFVSADYTVVDPGTANPSGTASLFDVGWTAGGGAAWAVTDDVVVRAEGLFLGLDERESTADIVSDSNDGDFVSLDNLYLFRLGLSYRF